MNFNKVLDLVEPFRKRWGLTSRKLKTGTNYQGKDKVRKKTHTLISIYDGNTDKAGTIEIAFKVEGISILFSKTSSEVNKWITHAEKEIGQYASPKTAEKYRRIAISSFEQFSNFLNSFDTFLTGANNETSVAAPESDNDPVVDELVMSEIRTRRGQKEFREKLFEIYDAKCAFTGCSAAEALEAAHITPHSEQQSYDLRNGLLLRADIHTLFDLLLISVNPENGNICVAESIMSSYSELEAKTASLPALEFIDPARLKKHYLKWVKKNQLTKASSRPAGSEAAPS